MLIFGYIAIPPQFPMAVMGMDRNLVYLFTIIMEVKRFRVVQIPVTLGRVEW
jgi:hypothetical protein